MHAKERHYKLRIVWVIHVRVHIRARNSSVTRKIDISIPGNKVPGGGVPKAYWKEDRERTIKGSVPSL